MRTDDIVTYYGEKFVVTEITGDNVTIANNAHTYNVPQNMCVFIGRQEKAEEPKKATAKKTSKK